MESPFFGWELLSAIIEDSVGCAADLIVAFVHWQLVKLSFSCLGNGDEKSIQNEDCGSECLPEDWNGEPNHYSLRYVLGNDVYILTCIVLEDSTCLFNLYNASKGTVSNVSLELREIMSFCTKYQQKKITEIIPKAEVLMMRIIQDLIVPVAGCAGCSNDTPYRKPDPVPPPRPPMDQHCIGRDQFSSSPNWGINYGPPVNIGRNPQCSWQQQSDRNNGNPTAFQNQLPGQYPPFNGGCHRCQQQDQATNTKPGEHEGMLNFSCK